MHTAIRSLPALLLLNIFSSPVVAQPEWRSWGSGDARPLERASAPSPTQSILNEIMQRQQLLEDELRELRDLVERQGHAIEMLKRAQKDSYADTDKRLRQLEQAGMNGGSIPTPSSQDAGAAPVPPSTPTAPIESVAVPAPPADAVGEQAAYDKAFNLLKSGKYQQAIKAFDRFVNKYPASPLTANALYWGGEARYVQGDLKGAMAQFERVVNGAPAHPKVPDALLKIGYLYYDQKQFAKAREILIKVRDQFPGSQAAKLADQRLKRMQKEGV